MSIKKQRLSKEQNRELILAKANELFRRMGYHKTAVADVARALGMSPANIYKHFASKEEIMDACASKYAGEIEDKLRNIAASKRPAIERLKNLAMEVYLTNREHFKNEKEIYKLVLAAINGNWDCIQRFNAVFLSSIKQIVEDGVKSGEFKKIPVAETVDAIDKSFTWIAHALIYPELEHIEVEAQLDAQIRLIEKGLA